MKINITKEHGRALKALMSHYDYESPNQCVEEMIACTVEKESVGKILGGVFQDRFVLDRGMITKSDTPTQ